MDVTWTGTFTDIQRVIELKLPLRGLSAQQPEQELDRLESHLAGRLGDHGDRRRQVLQLIALFEGDDRKITGRPQPEPMELRQQLLGHEAVGREEGGRPLRETGEFERGQCGGVAEVAELLCPDPFGAAAGFADGLRKSGQALALADVVVGHVDKTEPAVAEAPEVGRRVAPGGRVVDENAAARLAAVQIPDRDDRNAEAVEFARHPVGGVELRDDQPFQAVGADAVAEKSAFICSGLRVMSCATNPSVVSDSMIAVRSVLL